MNSDKNINDLIMDLQPKVIRFTGKKFPTELWSNNKIKKNKEIAV